LIQGCPIWRGPQMVKPARAYTAPWVGAQEHPEVHVNFAWSGSCLEITRCGIWEHRIVAVPPLCQRYLVPLGARASPTSFRLQRGGLMTQHSLEGAPGRLAGSHSCTSCLRRRVCACLPRFLCGCYVYGTQTLLSIVRQGTQPLGPPHPQPVRCMRTCDVSG
jgi:hypothetical protein